MDISLLMAVMELAIKQAAVQAEVVAEKIRAELSLPYQLDGAEYHTTPSIGIVTFRGHQDSKEKLLAEKGSANSVAVAA